MNTYDEINPCYGHTLNFIDDGDTETKYYELVSRSPSLCLDILFSLSLRKFITLAAFTCKNRFFWQEYL